ncbi:MAG: hypothetical protein M0Z77_11890 [Thermoplasmatales archaeon]|nr:hypothetical protein [Thermoplasmatales archaeon]
MGTIPLFVADRPASLRILEGLSDHKNEFGILAHAFTTNNFKEQFRKFPHTEYKVGDSGIYQGKETSYEELFSEYEKMGVKYGIIKDYYHDPERTLESAKLARRIYKKGIRCNKYSFELLGVAQGNTVAEYLKSYTHQKKLGFERVAIGGLLYKIQKHSRLVKVRSDVYLRNVLSGIRELYPEDKLFPLGIYNRERMKKLSDLDLWMADYKGWIFKYDIVRSHEKGDRFKQVRQYIRKNVFPPLEEVNPPRNGLSNQNEEGRDNKRRKSSKRLLIMSCSSTKNKMPGKAIEVYDGISYKIVRKYCKKHNHLDVKIISAKYGLLDRRDLIEPYDYKMNSITSNIYKSILEKRLLLLVSSYEEIFVFGGKNYINVLPDDLLPKVKKSEGLIGQQLRQLNEWLNSPEKPK